MKDEKRGGSRRSSAGGIEEELRDLIRISRSVGADPDLVQGGGGNTSVKTRDGRAMLVKASGTALADMDRIRGWAELDLARVRAILTRRGLSGLPPARRESKVLDLLAGTVVRPEGARPSVESNLHALLSRVVIHTHPVGLNALLASRSSRERCLALVGRPLGEPLYVPYIDPGYTLAARMEREIAQYRRRHGAPPAVVLLANHGLFVAAPEVGECLDLSREVTDKGRRFIGSRRTNPVAFPVTLRAEAGKGSSPQRTVEVRGALLRGGAAPVLVRRDDTPIAGDFLRSRRAVLAARRGAFTPDQIVYCRTYPLVLPAREGPQGTAAEAGRDRRAVEAYRARHALDPRVVLAPGAGVFYAAPDLSQLRIVADVYRAAMATILGSALAGGPRFLTARQARFIEGWEVEAFRARLAAGAARPLKGRIAVVRGASGKEGPEAVRMLVEAGATVAVLGGRGKARAGLAGKLGPSCIPLSAAAKGESALSVLTASVGGLDFFIDAEIAGLAGKDPGPAGAALARHLQASLVPLADSLKLLLRQGAGGAVGIVSGGSGRRDGAHAREVIEIFEHLALNMAKDLAPAGIRFHVYRDGAAAAEGLLGSRGSTVDSRQRRPGRPGRF